LARRQQARDLDSDETLAAKKYAAPGDAAFLRRVLDPAEHAVDGRGGFLEALRHLPPGRVTGQRALASSVSVGYVSANCTR